MPKKVTIFTLFIAAPTDALQLIRDCITNIVSEWNRTQGEQQSIRIEVKDWTTHSFPAYGKNPQMLINKQILDYSDIVVAIFWTRFGSANQIAGSGTEEEILRAYKRGLPIMIYFADRPAKPSAIDPVQYKRVLKFRKKHQHEGLYATFHTEAAFARQFRIHLSDTMAIMIKQKQPFKTGKVK